MLVPLPQRSTARCQTKTNMLLSGSICTLPSVTARSVSISASFFSASGASSMNDMATCTILVVACLSWPCFFESNSICSFSRSQSPESLDIVIIANSNLEVEARSDACTQQQRSVLKITPVLGFSYLPSMLLECR